MRPLHGEIRDVYVPLSHKRYNRIPTQNTEFMFWFLLLLFFVFFLFNLLIFLLPPSAHFHNLLLSPPFFLPEFLFSLPKGGTSTQWSMSFPRPADELC